MLLSDVKPMHCKKVLLSMDADYAGSTIRQTYITMGTLLKAAKMNDLIYKHPMDGVRCTKPGRASDDIHFLTRDEQIRFLEVAKRSHNYNQYALILETGLRTGEMIGLTWDAIDFQNRTLTVNKTLKYRHKQHFWRAGPPKTQQSYRTIPLTDRAYEILKEIKDKRPWQKESPLLSQTLEYIDRRTGAISRLVMRDLVFINWRTGEPAKNSSYNTHLYKLCDEAGRVILKNVNYNMCGASVHDAAHDTAHDTSVISKQNLLLEFCADPKSRDEMQAYIDVSSRSHFSKYYLKPLLSSGKLEMMFPDKPKSKNQKYTTVHSK